LPAPAPGNPESEETMQHQVRRLLAVAVGLGLCLAAGRADDPKDQPKLKLSDDEQKILDLTNEARAQEKLPPLKPDEKLFEAARAHSANMAKQGKMEHVLDGKDPADRVKATGYKIASVGENVAWSTGEPVKKIVQMWMDSKHHRENILKPEYEDIGIGIATNDKGETYYTQVFGTKRKR
jgi:uncharacterized protein YkwD